MTGFVAAAAAMVALALAFVLPPLLRRRETPPDARTAANAAIYREQLDELAAEHARGALSREEHDRARLEIERRIVAEHAAAGAAPAAHPPRFGAAIALGLLLPVLAGLAYWKLGNPEALTGVVNEAGHTVSREQIEGMVDKLAARMEQSPDDVEGWALLGRSLSVLGRFDRAAGAYARATKLAPQDANLLADYADTLAMARGRRLAGEPYDLVKRALAADPQHLKALALAGSAEFEAGRYPAAIGYWERILKIAPPDSEFARSVAESIDEARTLAGAAPAKGAAVAKREAAPAQAPAAAPSSGSPAAPAGGKALQGVVELDPALKGKVSPGDTVFVLARPADGSRMPLAVARTTVAALPYRFTLDDSMAMAPGATISSRAQVVVAARVSKSGNAITQKGDIEGASAPVAPGATNLRIVLSRIVE